MDLITIATWMGIVGTIIVVAGVIGGSVWQNSKNKSARKD